MEQIEDCFVKFFLRQAQEIEPETIQLLIENGYKSKLTLAAMDLVHDLPQIEGISLAQRSLLRKFIGALQENQPFTVNFTANQNEKNEIVSPSFPAKKRKLDAVQFDRDVTESDNNYQSTSFHSRNSTISPISSGSNSSNSNKRLNRSFARDDINDAWLNMEVGQTNDQEEDDDQQQQSGKVVSNSRKRGRKNDSTVRTPSQIRHEQMKLMLESSIAGTDSDEKMDLLESQSVSQISPQTQKKSRSQKKPSVRTPSQIRYQKMCESISATCGTDLIQSQQETQDLNHQITKNLRQTKLEETKTSSTKSKAMTPAEKALIERLEAKRQHQEMKKTSTPARKSSRRKK